MLKRIKSVSMLLALAGVSSTGAAYALAVPDVDDGARRGPGAGGERPAHPDAPPLGPVAGRRAHAASGRGGVSLGAQRRADDGPHLVPDHRGSDARDPGKKGAEPAGGPV